MTLLVGCTGHQAIPPTAVQFIVEEIDRGLGGAKDAVVGITSLAAGTDQMFALRVLRSGGSLHVVIPSRGYGKTFDDPEDLKCYQELLASATESEVLPFAEPTEEAFFAAGKRVVDLCDVLIAVWDGLPALGLGGTGDIVHYARQLERPIVLIWPPGERR